MKLLLITGMLSLAGWSSQKELNKDSFLSETAHGYRYIPQDTTGRQNRMDNHQDNRNVLLADTHQRSRRDTLLTVPQDTLRHNRVNTTDSPLKISTPGSR